MGWTEDYPTEPGYYWRFIMGEHNAKPSMCKAIRDAQQPGKINMLCLETNTPIVQGNNYWSKVPEAPPIKVKLKFQVTKKVEDFDIHIGD